MAHNRQWYSIKNEAGKNPEIFIFDDIDDWWGVSAQSIIDQIRELDATNIDVRINSRGGMVFEGIAIYNVLRAHKADIHVSIDGLAASIASVIAMAGDTVSMAENSMMMIHNPYGWAMGDADEMRKTADVMDKVTDSIAVSYTARTGKTVDEMKAMMDEETWFSAAEALELGLVDGIDSPVQAAACFDLSGFRNTPKALMADSEKEPEEEALTDPLAVADLCHAAGYPEKIAAFLKGQHTLADVKASLARYDGIQDLCKTAKVEHKAKAFINRDLSLEQVRSELLDHLSSDEVIDGSLPPNKRDVAESPVINTTAIYSKRNQPQIS
ncbi:head maturation protease, ClpP-related [Endozoicomonas euniceicola]|uniref:ATP-dependent Clp protease proteolytic subunit n=1 Tax=Endozoicomonas euniceicola TaxID=1234143 RepID=A0ABY6GVW8_9GAMM|nr:head maturation protease, ClpP-related [Endozoicomonas euniceicola]UYM16198.1 Clp protease ClpP [Endozoicomonas euniceicola]